MSFDQRGQTVLGSQYNSGGNSSITWVIYGRTQTGEHVLIAECTSRDEAVSIYSPLVVDWDRQFPRHKYRGIAMVTKNVYDNFVNKP